MHTVATMCNIVDRLFALHKASTSLERQQKAWGRCLKKPFPISDDNQFKVYFMFFEDIARTALYKGFHEQFVGMLRDLTTEYQRR
jgi:hypothetical protein